MLFSTKQRSSEFEIFHHAFVLNLSLKDTLQNSIQMVQVLPVISYRKISEFPIFRIFLFCININKLYRNYNNKVKRRRRKKNKYHKRWQVKCVSDESCLSVGVSQVKSCPGGGEGGEGVLNKVLQGECPLWGPTLPFLTKKVPGPFVYLLLRNGTPLYIAT